MNNKTSEWEKIGVIGIDAGLCLIGDPCYFLHKDKDKKPESIGKDWHDFCNILNGEDENGKIKQTWQFNYAKGHPGLGVCVSTGYGDGTYDVFAKRKDGRVAEVKIVFIDDEEKEFEYCDCCGKEELDCACNRMMNNICTECDACKDCCGCDEKEE